MSSGERPAQSGLPSTGPRRRLISNGGAIVLTASAAGLKADSGASAYGASKAGALHLMKVAAKEGAARRIRVNAVAPGGVETPI